MSRIGVDRVLKFAFELARKTPKKHLTSATKSNGIAITMPYWDERVEAMAKNYPDIKWDKYHIDILTALFVLNPDRFDVVVASNLFGDILSDLGPACTGTIGIAPSRQHQSGAQIPLAVRAGARLGAGHRRPGHRQPDRPDLVGRDDARASRRDRSRAGDRRGDREGAGRAQAAHPRPRRAAADTVPAARRSPTLLELKSPAGRQIMNRSSRARRLHWACCWPWPDPRWRRTIPTAPVTLLVPQAPGASSDLLARTLRRAAAGAVGPADRDR